MKYVLYRKVTNNNKQFTTIRKRFIIIFVLVTVTVDIKLFLRCHQLLPIVKRVMLCLQCLRCVGVTQYTCREPVTYNTQEFCYHGRNELRRAKGQALICGARELFAQVGNVVRQLPLVARCKYLPDEMFSRCNANIYRLFLS